MEEEAVEFRLAERLDALAAAPLPPAEGAQPRSPQPCRGGTHTSASTSSNVGVASTSSNVGVDSGGVETNKRASVHGYQHS